MDEGAFKLAAKSEFNQVTTSLRISSNLEVGRACFAVANNRWYLKGKKKLVTKFEVNSWKILTRDNCYIKSTLTKKKVTALNSNLSNFFPCWGANKFWLWTLGTSTFSASKRFNSSRKQTKGLLKDSKSEPPELVISFRTSTLASILERSSWAEHRPIRRRNWSQSLDPPFVRNVT